MGRKTLTAFLAAMAALALVAMSAGAVRASVVHDSARQVVTVADGQSNLVLRLNYAGACRLDQVVVRGRQVIHPATGVFSGIKVGDQWFTTRAGVPTPKVSVAGNTVTVRDILFGGGGVRVRETWRLTAQNDAVVWQIDRAYLSGGTLEDTCFPVWDFRDRSTWTGGLLGNGGVAWGKYLETPNATYGAHTGPVTFWSRDQRDCLRIVPEVPAGRQIAVKFTHQPGGVFSFSHIVSGEELPPRHQLRRFLANAQDLWAPFKVVPGPTRVTFVLQALRYDAACNRGTFRGLNGDSMRELLNTIGRYGVVDTGIMGGNGWRTGWACLHEQWFAQMGLAIDDPGYTANFAATLVDEREHAVKPDGRVLSRWHHDASDAMPGTFDPATGYYECQWGYTMDSQPSYVICTMEEFDLTGDLRWLRGQKPACERALDFLLRRDADGNGLVEMMTDSHTQGKCSDWIDVIWASWENALVNAEMYYAMVRWAEAEELLGDAANTTRYRQAAAKLKASFNRTTAAGGFWNPARQWYVYWRDKDGSIHGDNLVVPVNFAAIAYGLCDEPARREAILRQLETQMQRENLFHWPLCVYPYAPGEGSPTQYPFPKYENGDIFLSWGELGVRAYAVAQPDLALKYVRKVLDRYEADGLSFQRYLRQSQAGSGDDILAGNCLTIVGLYRDLYGIQPKWDRLYLEPHLTADLDGTQLRYRLRDQDYLIDLSPRGSRMTVGNFAVRDARPFAVRVNGNAMDYFSGDRDSCSLSVTRSVRAPVELQIETWPANPTEPRRWTETCAARAVALKHRASGLQPRAQYRLRLDGKETATLAADAEGRLEFTCRPKSSAPQQLEIVKP